MSTAPARLLQTALPLCVAAVAVLDLADLGARFPRPPLPTGGPPLDAVMSHEQRFAGVAAALHRRNVRGPIGYLADGPAVGPDATPRATADYYQTQFSLVPVVLDPNLASHEWCLANLRSPAATFHAPPRWAIVEDFGQGVLLLRKEAP
ncbi:MAG: hypothetical protein ACRDL8_03685 [Solirubrobacteraceae bacterium]